MKKFQKVLALLLATGGLFAGNVTGQTNMETDVTSFKDGLNLVVAREKADAVILEQNTPGPVSKGAIIRFYIPQSVGSATLRVHTDAGTRIGTYPIDDRGSGQFILHANTMNSGTYLYDLVTDGKTSEHRRLIITK